MWTSREKWEGVNPRKRSWVHDASSAIACVVARVWTSREKWEGVNPIQEIMTGDHEQRDCVHGGKNDREPQQRWFEM
jgi:hypothetical protein